MKDSERIVRLLDHDALERRVAAAIVIGELGLKGAQAEKALAAAQADQQRIGGDDRR